MRIGIRSAPACFLAALLLAGCASGPSLQPVSSKPDVATIYVFRVAKMAGAAAPISAVINGRGTGIYWAGEYTVTRVAPGPVTAESWTQLDVQDEAHAAFTNAAGVSVDETHPISVPYISSPGGKRRPLTFVAEAGKVYYLEVKTGFRFELHPGDTPPEELVTAKYSQAPGPFLTARSAQEALACYKQALEDARSQQQPVAYPPACWEPIRDVEQRKWAANHPQDPGSP